MITIRLLTALLLISALSLSCGTISPSRDTNAGNPITDLVHGAVDDLIRTIPAAYGLDREHPLIVSSLVDIDDLASSRLGRTLAEMITTRFVHHGFPVTELKLRERIYIRNREGELLLSRELPEITRKHAARSVVVGTYSPGARHLYVTIRLVDAASGKIVSSRDLAIPMDGEIRTLLTEPKHRLPMKH